MSDSGSVSAAVQEAMGLRSSAVQFASKLTRIRKRVVDEIERLNADLREIDACLGSSVGALASDESRIAPRARQATGGS